MVEESPGGGSSALERDTVLPGVETGVRLGPESSSAGLPEDELLSADTSVVSRAVMSLPAVVTLSEREVGVEIGEEGVAAPLSNGEAPASRRVMGWGRNSSSVGWAEPPSSASCFEAVGEEFAMAEVREGEEELGWIPETVEPPSLSTKCPVPPALLDSNPARTSEERVVAGSGGT